jgi:F0F1-type ATP synthase assembly protein I
MKNKESVKVVNSDSEKPKDHKKSQNNTIKQYVAKNKLSLLLIVMLFVGLVSGFALGNISSRSHMDDRKDGSQLRDGELRQRGGPGMRNINREQ